MWTAKTSEILKYDNQNKTCWVATIKDEKIEEIYNETKK